MLIVTVSLLIDLMRGIISVSSCNMILITYQAVRDGDKMWATVGTGTNQTDTVAVRQTCNVIFFYYTLGIT